MWPLLNSCDIIAFATDDHTRQNASDALVSDGVNKRVQGNIYMRQDGAYVAGHQLNGRCGFSTTMT